MFDLGNPLPWVIALAAISLMYSYWWHVEVRSHKWGPFFRRQGWLYVMGLFVFMAASSYFFADVSGLMLMLTQAALWGLPALGFKLKEVAEAYGREFQRKRTERALASLSQLAEEIVQGSFWRHPQRKARKRKPADEYEDAAALQARALTTAIELRFRMSVRDQYADPELFWRDIEELLERFVAACHRWRKRKQQETDYPEKWRS